MKTISTLEFEIYHNLASLSSYGNQILIWAQKKKSVKLMIAVALRTVKSDDQRCNSRGVFRCPQSWKIAIAFIWPSSVHCRNQQALELESSPEILDCFARTAELL